MAQDYPRFLESELEETTPEQTRFHVISAPYEATVSYGSGTGEGPQALLEASSQLELFDGESIPADMGIHTFPALDCSGDPEEALSLIEGAVGRTLDMGKTPVLIGGEHTVSLGAFRAIRERYEEVGIVQIDAHADLRDTYEGTPYSHACVMHRALDLDLPIYQLGIRAYSYAEHQLRTELGIPGMTAAEVHRNGFKNPLLPNSFPRNIYLTIDVDGLDPCVIPATGTPVPGGLSWYQTLDAIRLALQGRNCIGFDVVELAPVVHETRSDFAAAMLTYAVMGIVSRNG